MGPGSLISAMLEPCESRGQAMLTSVCMFVSGLGIGAITYACVLYTIVSHGALRELFEITPEYEPSLRARSSIYMMLAAGYTLSIVIGALALLMLIASVFVLVRSRFPANTGKVQR